MRRQDASVLALYLCGYTRLRNLLYRRRGIALTRFITFHDITEELEDDFLVKIDCLAKCANVVSLDDYHNGRLSRSRVNVVITFDDGYKGWVTRALPALKARRMSAVFFISSGFVGLTKGDQEVFTRQRLRIAPEMSGCLERNDVRYLREQGFEVGGHTCSHVDLSAIESPTEALSELQRDKAALEDLAGAPVKFFAYPFGRITNPHFDLQGVVHAAGYAGAVTLKAGFNFPATDPYLLRRELTGTRMCSRVFKARIMGAYDAVTSLRAIKSGKGLFQATNAN